MISSHISISKEETGPLSETKIKLQNPVFQDNETDKSYDIRVEIMENNTYGIQSIKNVECP